MTLTEKIHLKTLSINSKTTALLNALQIPELRHSLANQPDARRSLQEVLRSLKSDLKLMEDSRALFLKEEDQGEIDILEQTIVSVKAVIGAIEVIPEFKPQ